MPKIYVPQKNTVLEAESGSNLMETLLAAGLPVASSCLGEGICGKCRITVEGDLKKAELSEQETLTRNGAEPGERLSCQIRVTSEIRIRTSYW